MEIQRDEAYKTYMSDSAVLIFKALAGTDLDIPRYADAVNTRDMETEENTEQQAIQIKGKFDKLRRKTE